MRDTLIAGQKMLKKIRGNIKSFKKLGNRDISIIEKENKKKAQTN